MIRWRWLLTLAGAFEAALRARGLVVAKLDRPSRDVAFVIRRNPGPRKPACQLMEP